MKSAIMNKFGSQGGFTLLDIILVMAIIAVITVAVGVGELNTGNLEVVSVQLRSNIQLAQDLAMTDGGDYGFRAIDTDTYEIFVGAAGSPATNPHGGQDFIVEISPVAFSGPVATITFDASGVPDNAADETITLQEGSQSRTLTVAAETGFVTLTNP